MRFNSEITQARRVAKQFLQKNEKARAEKKGKWIGGLLDYWITELMNG
jgi:hypothetical protein